MQYIIAYAKKIKKINTKLTFFNIYHYALLISLYSQYATKSVHVSMHKIYPNSLN